ncbi:MAG: ABC transporter ATP-binding protein [Pseudomonadota bacterium]
MNPILELKNIECRYNSHTVVRNLSLRINQGTLACLLGPSGCGKTTVLRAIAGFEPVHHGEIILHGDTVSRSGYTLPPEKRRVGMVFQDYALFPHLDIEGNVGFGLRGVSREARRQTVSQLLQTVGLEGLNKRYPHELSGGQQQRVALARALAARPSLILMDEPFSNLDVDLRERLGLEVRDILKSQNIAALLVTHDQHEAFALGEMVGIMHQGHILQWDTPFNLYHEPADRFVAGFIGQGIFLKGTLLAPDSVETEVGIIRGDRAYPWAAGSPVDVLLRPDDIVPATESPLRGEVVNKAFKGASIMYTLRLNSGSQVLALFPSHHHHTIGESVGIRIDADHLIAFPRAAA